MITILLFSTTSFSVYKHFCEGNLVAISTEKFDSCCETEKIKSSNQVKFSEQNCCKNEASIKDILHFDYTNTVKITKGQVLFLTSFYYNFIQKITIVNTSKNNFKNFFPPSRLLNKQILFQTFLI
ncbi:hypothetical protein [uncultured Lutibacter sp.]|uniref:HYC_CC_PP family protein n=1 Tax=Lutibacter sp. TaxID=1925666 RepID=UPI002604AA25|nr:hypothetical protein [uncultured Lutibacter sp.]